MPEINPQRLMNDLRHLRTIGKYGTGVVRPAFSSKDMQGLPAGMLFIPSIRSISHDIAGDTTEEDIVRGCRALATATEALLRQANPV